MSNPVVIACFDCKVFIDVGSEGVEEWANRHVTHTTSLTLENGVTGWSGAFDNWERYERAEPQRQPELVPREEE